MTSATTFSPLQLEKKREYELIRCPVCQSRKCYPFAEKPEKGEMPRLDIRICAECGVLYNRVMKVE